MSSLRHVVHQGPVLAGLGGLLLSAAAQRLPRPLADALGQTTAEAPPSLPGPALTAVVPPRDPGLVADYLRWAGGDPGAWRGRVPHHLFPQWGFGLLPRTLTGLPYPLARALNGGCRVTVHADIPLDAALRLTAQLVAIDDDGRRALLTQRLTTALPDGTPALTAEVQVFVPLDDAPKPGAPKPGTSKPGGPKVRALVPVEAREVASHRFAADDGFAFACLTGDFNPVHWVAPYGRAAGFGGTILHGFGTLARALEGLTRTLWAGDTRRLTGYEVRFTRPVRLPGKARTFVAPAADEAERAGPRGFYVGSAPGGPAHMVGSFTARG